MHWPRLISMWVVSTLAQTVSAGTDLRQQAGGNDALRLHSEPWTSLVLHTSVNPPPEASTWIADLAHSWLTYSAPVAAAQAAGRPLVALESTIIAHGMPYPENIRTAREVEALIRAVGAEPATIALIGGRVPIGVSRRAGTARPLGPSTQGQPPRPAGRAGRRRARRHDSSWH